MSSLRLDCPFHCGILTVFLNPSWCHTVPPGTARIAPIGGDTARSLIVRVTGRDCWSCRAETHLDLNNEAAQVNLREHLGKMMALKITALAERGR